MQCFWRFTTPAFRTARAGGRVYVQFMPHNEGDVMLENIADQQDAEAVNEAMVQAMARRRQQLPEKRRVVAAPRVERRQVCGYCFQHGDHRTPAQCLRALER